MISLFRLENLVLSGVEVNSYAMVRLENEMEILIEPTMFLAHISLKSSSLDSVRSYGNDLLKFFRELDNANEIDGILSHDFRDITDAEMNAYLNAYLRGKYALKLSTINRHIASLKSFYDYSYAYGWISENKNFSFSIRKEEIKTSELEGITKRISQEYMCENDFNFLLDSVVKTNNFKNKRDKLALMLGYYVGFRSGELVNENNLRVDYIESLIYFDEKGRPTINEPMRIIGKGGKVRKARVCPEIVQPLYDYLKMVKAVGGEYLICKKSGERLVDPKFGSDLFRDTVDQLLLTGRVSKEEAVLWKLRHYHCGRKCYATNNVTFCYRPDVNLDQRVHVTKWMGHSDPKTTEVYIYFEALLYQRNNIFNKIDLSNINSYIKRNSFKLDFSS